MKIAMSRRERRIVVMPRSNRCLNELSSIMGWSSSFSAALLSVSLFLFVVVSEMLYDRLFLLPCCWAAKLARLPLEKFPLATRFILLSDTDFFIDESHVERFSVELYKDARSPELWNRICSSQ